MFAVLLHESMNPFYQTISSFPTVIFTILFVLCILYWAVAALGLVDIDIIDFDMDGDIDANDSLQAQEGIAGLLLKLGLNGVPLTIIITIFSLIGWVASYYICLFGGKLLPNLFLIEIAFEIVVFILVFICAVFLTAQVIKPIRKLFKKLEIDETKHIVGQVVVVRSSIVNKDRGEGMLNDGGAGLLLQIRATGDSEFNKGDEVIVIEQNKEKSLFNVVSKSDFLD